MKNSSGGFINFHGGFGVIGTKCRYKLCWDISSDKAFWLGRNNNEMRALVKG